MNTLVEETGHRRVSACGSHPSSEKNLLCIPSVNHAVARIGSDHENMQDLAVSLSRRPSTVVSAIRAQSVAFTQRKLILEFLQGRSGSRGSIRNDLEGQSIRDPQKEARKKNRRIGDDSLTTSLSALYAKLIVVLGIALPVTDILSLKAPPSFYQGFYLYLYVVSVMYVTFMYATNLKTRVVFDVIDQFEQSKRGRMNIPRQNARFGSFYLRVGAIAFGIGSMVYSGLEFGQYFELNSDERCQNVLIALTPIARMTLCIVQMQFIFLNTREFQMNSHKVISRFGLMHMVATNLCEWLYVLVEETKHEIVHLMQSHNLHNYISNDTKIDIHHFTKRATALEIVVECRRTNIMGSLVQKASPFLFPCTIEYSLICAVILFEMWKRVRTHGQRKTRDRKISSNDKGHQLTVDCARAHRGMFVGILVIVLTIICLIMYFVLSAEPTLIYMATLEVTISELILYILTSVALIGAFFKMRDLKFSNNQGTALDCTLLVLAQSGVYIYCMFSIVGCYFSMLYEPNENHGGTQGLIAEVFSLFQTSLQTIFILNAWWRRCQTTQQCRRKPGREVITFLLVANMAMWFINTLVKGRAMFRPTHLRFFGVWAWTIITHVSMPLAIFYRFHSTICLFEIWKSTYKCKHTNGHGEES